MFKVADAVEKNFQGQKKQTACGNFPVTSNIGQKTLATSFEAALVIHVCEKVVLIT